MWILINCGRDELSPLPIYSHTDITGPNLVTAAAASQVVILHSFLTSAASVDGEREDQTLRSLSEKYVDQDELFISVSSDRLHL